MRIVYDPICAEYGSAEHPERPERVVRSSAFLRERHPGWRWEKPAPAGDEPLLRAHRREHFDRLREAEFFDADTPAYPDIEAHARRSAGAALRVLEEARAGRRAFSLMRPPGHHACKNRIMGFCYFNNVAIAALEARGLGTGKVAIWDFDAHHGNGTEDIVRHEEGIYFASIHQYPGYPGTGRTSYANIHNFPVPPGRHRHEHIEILESSFEAIVRFKPELLLVSAGFDAYRGDPITNMDLEIEDFGELGRWVRESGLKAGAVLEGGYAEQLPEMIDAFLVGWEGKESAEICPADTPS